MRKFGCRNSNRNNLKLQCLLGKAECFQRMQSNCWCCSAEKGRKLELGAQAPEIHGDGGLRFFSGARAAELPSGVAPPAENLSVTRERAGVVPPARHLSSRLWKRHTRGGHLLRSVLPGISPTPDLAAFGHGAAPPEHDGDGDDAWQVGDPRRHGFADVDGGVHAEDGAVGTKRSQVLSVPFDIDHRKPRDGRGGRRDRTIRLAPLHDSPARHERDETHRSKATHGHWQTEVAGSPW